AQYTIGKAADTFCPMGPGVVLAEEIPDPQRLDLATYLNGERVQSGSTADMIFSVAESISFISQVITLEPGDIIATGTPAGVGYKRIPPRFLTPGDLIEVEVLGVAGSQIQWSRGDVSPGRPVVIRPRAGPDRLR
ncbi:5-carboxymethyl-2-hydroxymuconate delta-isomerase, partial [mine drainage metagenome]